MKRSLLAGLLVAAFVASPASAQPVGDDPPPLPLETVIDHVRAGNSALRAGRLSAEALGTRRAQAATWQDPMVSGQVNAGPGRMQRSQLMVEQALPWPDVLALRGRAADAAAAARTHDVDALEAELVLRATEAYVEAAGIEQKLAQIEHFRNELAAFEQAAAVQYETGAGPQQAILRTQLEKNGLLQRSLALTARLHTLRQTLLGLMGSGIARDRMQAPLLLPDRPGPVAYPADSAAAFRRPEWIAREADLRRVYAQRDLADRAFRPDLSVRLSWMEGSIMRDHRDAVGIGVGVRIPLWRAPRRAAVQEQELDRQRLEALQADLLSQVVTGSAALRAQMEGHLASLDLLDGTLLPQAEATQQATASAYTNGRADYLDLLEAERMLLDLRLDRIDHHVQLLVARARLDRIAPHATDS